MCGIVGAIGGDPGSRESRLAPALAALAHRGPDGHGTFLDEQVSLGHARLAIIDPTVASDQPMIDAETGCVLIYNGEIYNYVELRDELSGRHRFTTAGDTEVLLRSYLEWGERCTEHLNGMFAFALWDPRSAELLLARDRVGEKPLHLAHAGGALRFASEIKSLRAAGVAGRQVDRDAVFSYLALGDVVDPTETFFEDVEQLPAGCTLRVSSLGGERRRRYWSVPAPVGSGHGLSPDEAADGFAELFHDSVRLRLRSDVPLGTSLSGGLDSSAVLVTLRALRPTGELHAFTASFPGSAVDELPQAQAVAEPLGVTVHPVPLHGADLAADLDAMLGAEDAPVGSASVFAEYRVMREARLAGVTVLLDGQGADETWLGYDVYAGSAVLDDLARGRFGAARRRRADWLATRGHPLRPPLSRYGGLVGPPAVRRAAVAASLRAGGSWPAPEYRAAHRRADPLASIPGRASRPGRVAVDYAQLDIGRLLLPRLLQYADRNSMAWSREVRLPFLDHRLIELASQAPVESRIVDGWTKEPVRRLLERAGVPATARRRDKLAYQPPHDEWLHGPEMAPMVTESWRRLHDLGMLSGPAPAGPDLVRWRVLAVDRWAQSQALDLV